MASLLNVYRHVFLIIILLAMQETNSCLSINLDVRVI